MKSQKKDSELNALFEGKLNIFQKKKGYRFSVDSILLGSFTVKTASGTVADLGTGSGILPVILARHKKFVKITGIEIQKDLADLAEKNVIYNKCSDRVDIVHADIKRIQSYLPPGKFDAVITNPPFYSFGSGRISADKQNAAARHELNATLGDFISSAALLLKQTGKFIAVYTSSRIADLIVEMRQNKVEPKTIQFVHARLASPANMFLIEGVKGAGTEATALPPMILYNDDGSYTEQARAVFDGI